MQRYDTYKPSGVKWLGEIPSHWEVLPGLAIFKENKERNSNLAVNTVLSLSYGKIVVKKDIDEGLVPAEYNTYQIVHPGYIIIRCTDLQNDKVSLRTGLVKDDGIITGAYLGLVTNGKYNSSFMHYFLHAWDITKEIYRHGNGLRQSLSWLDLRRLPILIPPIAEQTAIANYLDTATAKIDAAIAQQQKMIDLLNERKQIIINRAVTKGLNPNAKMKDSGVEWIGEVPEHWKLLPYRYLFYNLDKMRMPITADQRSRNNPQYDYYGASGVIDKIDYYNVDDKVLLIGEDGANLLMRNLPIIYKAEGKFWVNNHAHILKPIRDDYDYLAYVMEAADYTLFITGSAQPKLSQANLNCVKLPIPPLEEQKAIVDYLSKRTSKIDEAIKESNNMISLLQERKQIIINEVVTGKVRVI
jgi:type I restriction enzyme S subunit